MPSLRILAFNPQRTMDRASHNFVLIEQLSRRPVNRLSDGVTGPVWRDEYGARVGCPICGEVRVIWANGDIVVEKLGNIKLHGTATAARTRKK